MDAQDAYATRQYKSIYVHLQSFYWSETPLNPKMCRHFFHMLLEVELSSLSCPSQKNEIGEIQ